MDSDYFFGAWPSQRYNTVAPVQAHHCTTRWQSTRVVMCQINLSIRSFTILFFHVTPLYESRGKLYGVEFLYVFLYINVSHVMFGSGPVGDHSNAATRKSLPRAHVESFRFRFLLGCAIWSREARFLLYRREAPFLLYRREATFLLYRREEAKKSTSTVLHWQTFYACTWRVAHVSVA